MVVKRQRDILRLYPAVVDESANVANQKIIKGRGSASRPDPRYLETSREAFDDGWANSDESAPQLKTRVTDERIASIINRNQSPDLPFNLSINPYRGCEHGCAYCYARPAHAYVDLSPGLDFESRLFAKPDAPEILRRELSRRDYRCEPISIGANTDCYQPLERKRGITRGIIEVLAECRHPLTIVTKSALIERDLDLLAPMAERNLVQVFVSVTTLDRELARRMEPRAAAPQRRLETQRRLAAAGIPTGVMVAPVIPALNDHELESILTAAAESGCRFAGYIVLRLPREVRPLFKDWLASHYPLRAEHVLSRVRQIRGGEESDSQFGRRMKGEGVFAELLKRRFENKARELGIERSRHELNCADFRKPGRNRDQLELF